MAGFWTKKWNRHVATPSEDIFVLIISEDLEDPGIGTVAQARFFHGAFQEPVGFPSPSTSQNRRIYRPPIGHKPFLMNPGQYKEGNWLD